MKQNVLMENILAVFARATSQDKRVGQSWYVRANRTARQLARKYGLTMAQAAGVLAALSPGRAWEVNVRDAEEFISAWTVGARGAQLPKVGTYGAPNRTKAAKILAGHLPLDVLCGNRSDGARRSGHKVRIFYVNILQPNLCTRVTIDRHAQSVAEGHKLADAKVSEIRSPHYERYETAYVEASAEINLRPNQLQAIVWLAWRRQPEVPF